MVRKQQVVENFSGQTLNERWTLNNPIGSGSGAMLDAIDGGYQLTSGSNLNDIQSINFNSIAQYDFDLSAIYLVMRKDEADARMAGGLLDGDEPAAAQNHMFVRIDDVTDGGNDSLATGNGTTSSQTDLGVASTTTQINYLLRKFATYATAHRNGVFVGVKTTLLPTGKMEPLFKVKNKLAGAGRKCSIQYLEALNY